MLKTSSMNSCQEVLALALRNVVTVFKLLLIEVKQLSDTKWAASVLVTVVIDTFY